MILLLLLYHLQYIIGGGDGIGIGVGSGIGAGLAGAGIGAGLAGITGAAGGPGRLPVKIHRQRTVRNNITG